MTTIVRVSVSPGRRATVTQIVQGAPSPLTPVGVESEHEFICLGNDPDVMDTFLIQEEAVEDLAVVS